MSEFERDGFKHSEREIADFVKEYRGVICRACASTGLCRADWEAVVYDVAVKYADGRMEYDPSKNAAMSTYVYAIARREAINTWKKSKAGRCIVTDPGDIVFQGGWFSETRMSKEDCVLRINEALNRLSAGRRNPQRIAIFIRHAILQESRESVARRFGVSIDTVSMAKHNLLPKFGGHLKAIAEEEAKGLYSKRGDKVFIRKEDLPF